jgi:uncharacterized protein YbjT (DUF2867 family)
MLGQPSKKIQLILTGATGMVGEAVLHEALQSDIVEKILVINRKPCGTTHKKLQEIIHADFFNLSPIANQLSNYNACFFCLGVSSVGMKEQEFYQKTYVLTMHVAALLSNLNPQMTFCYISGAGTDSTEKGRQMWARVKGKTENDLIKLPFKQVYNFHPGILQPTKGLKNTLKYYHYLGWLLPIIKFVAPKYICTLKQLGLAMITVATKGYEKQVLEVKDIIEAAKE